MEQERKRIKLPVEVDDEYGFSIDEKRLDESLKKRLEEIAKEEPNRPNIGLRMLLASILGLFFMFVLTVLVLRGSVLFAGILFCILVSNVGKIAQFVEGRDG